MSGKKGFTLVELAVVIAVISIAIGYVVVSYSALRRDAVVETVVRFTTDFQRALQRFQSIHGRLPQTLLDANFVPDYIVISQMKGVEFVGYSRSNSYCQNKPTIELRVYDAGVIQELSRTLRLCSQNNESVVITLSL